MRGPLSAAGRGAVSPLAAHLDQVIVGVLDHGEVFVGQQPAVRLGRHVARAEVGPRGVVLTVEEPGTVRHTLLLHLVLWNDRRYAI